MDLIERLYGSRIEKISLFTILDKIDNSKESVIGNNLWLDFENKKVPLKCVREYYCDPLTQKKMPKVNLANPCNKIKITFGVTDSYNCRDCHYKLAEKCLSGEISMYKK